VQIQESPAVDKNNQAVLMMTVTDAVE